MTVTSDQLSEIRKRHLAEHHAAHLVVACVTGGEARAWLWQRDTAGSEAARWLGYTAVIKYGHVGAPQAAGRVANALEYEPEQDLDEYFDELLLSDFICAEELEELTLNEAFELVTNAQLALKHLVQNRAFFDWAVERLMTVGLITEGQASEFIRTSAGTKAAAGVLQLSDAAPSSSQQASARSAVVTAGS